MGGAGVQRTLKYVKYLPDNNWIPVVLTGKHDGAALQDHSLTSDISSQVSIVRTKHWGISPKIPYKLRNWITRWILCVDEQVGWSPFAIHQGKQLIARNNIEVIYTTSPPVTDHIVGGYLKKKTGLPWVADFRDLWIGNFASDFPTRLHERVAYKIESRLIELADRILVISEPMRQTLLERYPNVDVTHVLTIPNGYDPDDFSGVTAANIDRRYFNIIYTGSFYQKFRTPLPFLVGLREILDSGEIPSEKIRVYFIGNIGLSAQRQVKSLGLAEIVHTTGYVSHKESVSWLLSADLLLLMIGRKAGSEVVTTGKIYEYMASMKPILAIIPPGIASELIREARAGYVIDPEDIQGIRNMIVELFGRWQANALSISPNTEFIAHYDRRLLTGRLAQVFDALTI